MCRYRHPGMLAALVQDSVEDPVDPPPGRRPEADDALPTIHTNTDDGWRGGIGRRAVS